MQIINLKKLSRRDRRALGIGVSLLVVVFVGLYVILPFYEARGHISQDVESQKKLPNTRLACKHSIASSVPTDNSCRRRPMPVLPPANWKNWCPD